jgi:hypothetical protein
VWRIDRSGVGSSTVERCGGGNADWESCYFAARFTVKT